MLGLGLAFLVASAQPGSGADLSPAEQRALFEAGQARQRAFELHEFGQAGFDPLERARPAGGEIRRVLFSDPYFILPTPGVEIRRDQRGAVSLQVVGSGVRTPPTEIAPEGWAALARLDAAVFRRPAFVVRTGPRPAGPAPPAPPICHAWIVRFASTGAAGERTASWAGCGDKDEQRLAYAAQAARLAVATRPACSFDPDDPFWSFSRCFRPQPAAPAAAGARSAAPGG